MSVTAPLPARLSVILVAVALSAVALSGCSSPGGGVGLPGAGPAPCPALLVPTAADEKKTTKWPATTSSDLVDKLAIGDVIKGSCVYDLADAPADAGVGTDAKGVIFVQVNAKAADAAKYITETAKYLKGKKFTVQTQDDGFSGSFDSDKDGTADVAVTAAYEKKVTQDSIDGDSGEFYKIFGIKAGGSVLFGSVGTF